MMIEIDSLKCIRCEACVRDCPVGILKPDADGIPCVAPEEERFCLNCQHCLAICPKGAVHCQGVAAEDCAAPGPLPQPDEMANLFRQRRSIRQFRDESLPPEILVKMTDLLAWTPTGENDRRMIFVVVQDKSDMEPYRTIAGRLLKLLSRIGIFKLASPDVRRFQKDILNDKDVIFRNAPHLIIAAVHRKAPCHQADPWIALSAFDWYAQTLGIGTCWGGLAVNIFRWSWQMRRRLNLPSGYRVGAVMLFGKPAVRYARSTRPPQFEIR